jgi:hypothetical protein
MRATRPQQRRHGRAGSHIRGCTGIGVAHDELPVNESALHQITLAAAYCQMRVQSCSAYFEVYIRRTSTQAESKDSGYAYAKGGSARNRPSRRAFTAIGYFRNSMRWRKTAKLFIRALTIKKNWNTEWNV